MTDPTPDQLVAHAADLHRAGRWGDAEKIYRRLLAQNPNFAPALNLLGVLATQNNHHDHALALIRRAIAIDPVPDYHRNLGLVLASLQRFDEAVESYRNCLRGNPQSFEASLAMGQALARMERASESAAAFEHCLAIRPDDSDALSGLGNALLETGDLQGALAKLARAGELMPQQAQAHLTRALILLMQGDFETGWREFDWRWQIPELQERQKALGKPRWRGEELHGARLLLHAERGFGDTINFARFIPHIVRRGARVIFACQPELRALLSQVQGIEHIALEGEKIKFDLHCSVMDLPAAFATTLDTVPSPLPFLAADPGKTAHWKSRVPHDGKTKIGLVWSGNTQMKGRALPIASLLQSLSSVPDLWLCSLQKGEAAKELSAIPHHPVADWTADLHDFSDTAALIANLDVIIGNDTAVTHLAGAMGKRVFTLLKFYPDWRWALDRQDTPWYPTMSLFRQRRLHDWSVPIAEAAQALRLL